MILRDSSHRLIPCPKAAPGALASTPGTIDNFIEPFILSKMVRIGSEPIEVAIAFCNALKEVNREKVAFGFYGGKGVSVSSTHGVLSSQLFLFTHSFQRFIKYGP